jgi:putative addiction module antidote
MLKLKVTNVGGSMGFILPKAAAAKLGVQKGDTVYFTEAPDGSYRLTPFDPEFERQMEIARRVMHADRDALKALSKL